jgi:hypothetical protein
LQDFGTHPAETLQSLHTKINKNRQNKCGFIQFLTGDKPTEPEVGNYLPRRRETSN